ncbi:MAG: hypothetical protein IT459_18000 [Planctomycetes bacterium]|nr:hypothetical protein [Planctomycetota bacterium]
MNRMCIGAAFVAGAALLSVVNGCAFAPRGSDELVALDLGPWSRPTSFASAAAQRRFDEGLTLAYAFNHDEAVRRFEAAARHDPSHPMPYWGIALVHGPHVNKPDLPLDRAQAAFAAWNDARARIERASPVERALVEALGARYSADPDAPRAPLDRAYADAMRTVHARFPDDPDVGALTAEALMDLQPWDYWAADGAPKGNTTEFIAILERDLDRFPTNPGLNHLYIHAMEAGPMPQKAKAAADRLRSLTPDAGHLLHMPAHVDIRLGDFELASEANRVAMAADARLEAATPRAGFYRVYMAHNPHFLAFTSMMQGNFANAHAAARAMIDGMPQEFIREAGALADGFAPVEVHVLVRFGKWNEILDLPAFAEHLLFANATRHYARGVALTALDRTDEAALELAALEATAAKLDARVIGINEARVVIRIACDLLAGELAFRRGDRDGGLALLRAAVATEDTLLYMEPPDWMMPARHPLGAALLEAGRFDEAARVFREDLARFPENGWALFGLSQAMEGLGDANAAADARRRHREAFAHADVELRSPCFCQPGVGFGALRMLVPKR